MTAASGTRPQISGTSDISVDDAIAHALQAARLNYGEPDWFDVIAARGYISNGRVTFYQVTLDLGYEGPADTPPGDERESYFGKACSSRQSETPHTVEVRF